MSWFNDVIRDSAISKAGGQDAERALAEQQIRSAYQQSLGRAPTDQEIASQLANGYRPEQVQNAVDSIAASSERNAYLSAHQNEDGSYQPDANTLAANTAKPPAPTATTTPAGGGGGSASEFGQAWLNSGSNDLGAFMGQWNQSHPGLQASFSGKKNHDITIGGQTYHAVNSDGAKFWMGGGSGGGTSDRTAFTEQFSYPTWDKTFTPPTADQVYSDPVVQSQLKLGTHAIQNSAAAKGTLLTTGTLKDLDQFGQTVGATYGADVYNRALGQYDLEKQNYLQNYGKALGEYQQRAGIFNSNFNNDLAGGYYGLAGQGQQFNQTYSLANLGLNAANSANANLFGYSGLYGNTLASGANNYLSGLYGGANATAAGQVGSANAWNSGLANLGNIAQQTAYLYGTGYGNKPNQPPYGTANTPGQG